MIETDLVLQGLLADLSDRSEFEVDLLSKLVLACGDVSLVPFVDMAQGAIAADRDTLKGGCQVVVTFRLSLERSTILAWLI